MSKNVVDFNARKEQKEQSKEAEFVKKASKHMGFEASDDVIEQLERYNDLVDEFVIQLDKTLIHLAEQDDEKKDISLPLESLSRLIARTASEFDVQIQDEKELEKHFELRLSLAETISKSITDFVQSHSEPIYQQDIYISMTHVLVSYLQQHRIYLFSQGAMESEDNHETSGSKDRD